MDLSPLVYPVLGAVVGSAATWFVFARSLTTRGEVQDMVDRAMKPLDDRQNKSDRLLEAIREEISGLREDVVRLTTVLERLSK